MKMWLRLAVVLVLLAPAAGRAHIGDSLAQLQQVYGASGNKRVGNAIIFQRNGYSICVYFDGSKSGMEIFTRDGSDKTKTDISQKDIENILELEGEGQGWSEMASTDGKVTCWLRGDKKLIARLSPGDKPGDSVFVVMVNQK